MVYGNKDGRRQIVKDITGLPVMIDGGCEMLYIGMGKSIGWISLFIIRWLQMVGVFGSNTR